MRRLLFVLMASVLLMACKKQKVCVKCFEYDDIDYGLTTYCLGDDFTPTEKEFNQLITDLEGEGYLVNYTKRCR
ncbi:MAG: hypothetical protein M9958_05760 [Chitinophagales bacterium]|nr:hypothetical protein [Chitinophagales bacterium]